MILSWKKEKDSIHTKMGMDPRSTAKMAWVLAKHLRWGYLNEKGKGEV